MGSAFDHIFICTARGGAEAAGALAGFGLHEGPANVHPGQGTACRRFMFANSYLELLWVSNPDEVQSEVIRPTQLWERWSGRASGACPFGLGFRPKIAGAAEVPFTSWEYRPPFLPAPLSFQVATNANVITEPMLFYLPFGQRPDCRPGWKRPGHEHPAGLREVTRVELASPYTDKPSPQMAAVMDAGLAQMRGGPEFLVEIGFDGESQGQVADFRPLLPLLFRW